MLPSLALSIANGSPLQRGVEHGLHHQPQVAAPTVSREHPSSGDTRHCHRGSTRHRHPERDRARCPDAGAINERSDRMEGGILHVGGRPLAQLLVLAGVRGGGRGSLPPCHAASAGSSLGSPLANGKAR